ncbi:MAG: succinate dehydrogenase cytochrome b subunit [Dermatophilaceae bacterium]
MTTLRTLTPVQQRATALRSTVMLKVVMAISGLFLILFLVAHMYGNLHTFAGQEVLDNYGHSLRTLGEPFLPYEGALWLIRVTLLAAVVLHVYSAATLWKRARAATGGGGGSRYESTQARTGVQRSYASYTMRWGGVTVGLFIIYHLLHLTTNTLTPGGASSSSYQRLVNGFEIWWVTLSYAIAVIALGFHIRHGIWSAFATLGANTSARRRRNLNAVAVAVALVITLGFLAPPLSILFGWIG